MIISNNKIDALDSFSFNFIDVEAEMITDHKDHY